MTMQTIYNKFEKEQAKKRKEYLSAGMSEEQIKIMYDFDKAQLARNIAYRRRTQEIETGEENSTYEENKLLEKFRETLSVEMDMNCASKYFWIDNIEKENIKDILLSLKESDLELIDLYFVKDFTQEQIANYKNCSQKNISKKVTRICNKIKELIVENDKTLQKNK